MVAKTSALALLIAGLGAANAQANVTVSGQAGAIDCVTGAHLTALAWTFDFANPNNTETGVTIPAIPEIYSEQPSLCVPDSLFELYIEAIDAQATALGTKDAEFETSIVARSGPRGSVLTKRARNCRQMQEAEISSVHSYSCSSAPHPDQCVSCARWSTATFLASMAACGYKEHTESIYCCAQAVLAFGTYYTQACLSK